MRPIGTLPDAKAAAVFGDFLVGRRMPNQMDRESDGTFTVWIKDDDHLPEATRFLKEFLASPQSDRFRNAAAEAQAAKRAEEEDLEAFRKRLRTADGIFAKTGSYGVGRLSYALIAISVGVAILTSLGRKDEVVDHLLIDDPNAAGFLVKAGAGEVWRLITGLGSNFAQYLMSGPNFGGMSGVVYALIGYCWIRGKYDRTSGIFLDRRNWIISIVWMVACFTGLLGPVANTAHVSGWLLGMALGRLAAWRSGRIIR